MNDIIKETKKKMDAALDHLKQELKNIRTGRANPGMLDNVMVEVYGTQMPLRDIANITAPEPRQLLITPYDAHNAGPISKGIERANLGIRPILDGNVVRMQIPPMDEAMRKEMVKLSHKRKEECKVSVRNVRRDSNEIARKQKTEGTIPEDLLKKLEKEIQELTDKYCKQADDLCAAKEKEIATI